MALRACFVPPKEREQIAPVLKARLGRVHASYMTRTKKTRRCLSYEGPIGKLLFG